MDFLNPALLAGTALFLVPLVIHLLNRQRHRRRPWAAMDFLLRAYQKQRNRLRNENLLLLLLRCLIPILLALAIARPVLREAAALLGGAGFVHHVIVLDSSYSMGFRRDGGASSFERARTLAGRLLDRLEARTEKRDKVTLVTAGVRPVFRVRADLDLGTARSQWLQLTRPEDAATDLTEAMVQVASELETSADPDVQIYLLTDLQARAFGKAIRDPSAAEPAQPEFRDTLRDITEQLAKRPGTTLHVIDCGPYADSRRGGVADNVQIAALRVEQAAAVARMPLDVVATVRNRGTTAVTAEVTLELDGAEPMRKLVPIEAGAEGEAEFQVVCRETGRRRLRAALIADGLEADDERFASIDVRERIRVLLVDGAADDDPLRSYGWLWRGILDPDPLTLPTFQVDVVEPLQLLGGQRSPELYDVTVLADVDRLNERAAMALQRALQAGKGLLVAYGEHTDLASFDLHLNAADSGPQPFRLLRVAGSPAGSGVPRAPSIAMPDHPVLREFDEEIYREIFQATPVYRWLQFAKDSLGSDAQVLVRLTDAEQSPLLVARAFGEGRALFLTSAPASEYRPDRWNRFDFQMVAFHLLHGMVKWLSLPASDPFNVTVGAELTCSLPARPENVSVLKPERDGGAKVPLSEDSRPLPGGRHTLPPFAPTVSAGFHTFELLLDRETGKEPLSLPFAVNVDPEEGELRYAAHDDVRTALGIATILTGLPVEGAAAADPEASEFGPLLLLLTLLFVIGEAAMARYVSGRRT